ncbi:MAG: type II toxin-antitoxin system VapC family toxin [Thiobacillaceae bacterium]|nr:type II toxin-antitoxin system VapC family toxin [Thiobacillaceae bacterium]MCX7673288.1 type II toxin-antitoxin system VapC family toxin [Thiobacillaceae bacterium]MDW8324896.1 type II toxin-antitoxin system VapC family toxin [Burkholderiales bacterium]
MRYLIDTCVFLWVVEDSPRLSKTLRTVLQNPDHEIYLSAVSIWEITLKHQLGKLPLSRPVQEFVAHFRQVHGIASLPLSEEEVFQLGRLPMLHRDPFDRLLVGQAIAQGLVIITPDQDIHRYPVRVLWT